MQPYDYRLHVQQPFEAVMQGFQGGAAIRQIQEQRQAQADLGALAANPNATGQEYASMMARYPQFAEQLQKGWSVLSAEQQKGKLAGALRVYAAMQANPAVAAELLRDEAKAHRNSGSEEGARHSETMAKLVEADPVRALNTTGMSLAVLMGPDKFAETLVKLGAERRAEASHAPEMAKKEADAAVAAEQARNAPVAEAAKARKTTFDAMVAEINAKTAPDKARAELARIASEIQLDKAQASQAIASARKLSVEAQVAAVEAAGVAAGKLPKDKRFDAEQKLRKEHSDQTKGFQEVNEAFRRIGATEDSGAGDIALIFAYMKMLDPGSVVREGEFANAENSAGIPERVRNAYNRALNGERLAPSQRNSFKSQAGKLFNEAKRRDDEVRSTLTRVADKYGLDKESIFATPAAQEAEPPPKPAPKGDDVPRITSQAEFAKLPSGTEFIGPDGRKRRKP